MVRFVGDQSQVLFKFESGTYSVASGTGQWFGIATENNLSENVNVQSIRYLGGADRNVDIHVDGALDIDGTLTFHPQDWKTLGFALGSMIDVGSPSPYGHNLEESNSGQGNAFTSGALAPFLSFTVEDFQGVLTAGSHFVRTANGCVVDTWSISASQGDIVQCEMSYVAQNVVFSSGAKTAVTAATTRPFLWQDVKIHLPSGTVINEIKSFDFNVNNNLEKSHYLNGSREIAVPLPLNRDYELSFTADGTSQRTKQWYDQFFRGGSQFNVLLEVTDSSAGAGSRSLFVSLSGCKLTEMDVPSTSEGAQEQSLTIVPTSASAVVEDLIELYNIF